MRMEMIKEIRDNVGLIHSRAYNVYELIEHGLLVTDTERRYTHITEQLISLDNDYKGHIEEFKEYAYYIEYISKDKKILTNVFKVRNLKALNWLDEFVHKNCRTDKKERRKRKWKDLNQTVKK